MYYGINRYCNREYNKLDYIGYYNNRGKGDYKGETKICDLKAKLLMKSYKTCKNHSHWKYCKYVHYTRLYERL
jgi:hypothetical protein